MKPKIDLRTHCALCGARFPLTSPMYANMSGTYHQSQLPCPCETRRPPDPPPVPKKPFAEMTREEIDELMSCIKNGRPAPWAEVDLDP